MANRNFVKNEHLRTSVFSIQKFVRKNNEYIIMNSFDCQSFIYTILKDPQHPKKINLVLDSQIKTKAPVSSCFYDTQRDILYIGTLFGQILIIDKYTPNYNNQKTKLINIGECNLQNSISNIRREENVLFVLNYHNKLVQFQCDKQNYRVKDDISLQDYITCICQQSVPFPRTVIKFSNIEVPMLFSSFRFFIPTYNVNIKECARRKQLSLSQQSISNHQQQRSSQQTIFLDIKDKYVISSNGINITVYSIFKLNGFEILNQNYIFEHKNPIYSISIMNNYIMILDEISLEQINLHQKKPHNKFIENNFKPKLNLIFAIDNQFLLTTYKYRPSVKKLEVNEKLSKDLGYWIFYFQNDTKK